jgi:transcriptional regulator with GAF, ATPase, and Fis domain
MARLIVIEGPDLGSEHDLQEGGPQVSFTAGRDPRADVPLSDTAVSRQHFRLEWSPRGWRAIDLGSRNQTFLNGEPMKEAFLSDGDVLRAGDTEVRFERPGAAVELTGGASTIIKEIPVGARAGTAVAPGERMAKARRTFASIRDAAAGGSAAELAQKLLEEILATTRADRAAILVRDGAAADGRWLVRAGHEASSAGAGGAIRVSTSIVRKVAEEGKAVLFRDPLADERLRDKASVVAEEIASAVAAPVETSRGGAGVLYADRRGGNAAFVPEDLEILAEAADAVGPVIDRLAEEVDLKAENRNLIRSIAHSKRIIGRSPAVTGILEFIRRAAPTPMTVLIQGETGTGKELVASAIHYASPRRGRPFVAINCAALPENLVESELFGHERGAFTGAVTRKKGRFELADRGTILLDEVGELSLACQAKLLRLLEERELERLGGVEPIPVDVRVVAATNKNLLEAVSAGAFREDLYYRLSVLNLEVPPLRERPEDIALLAHHFVAESSGGQKKLGEEALARLIAHPWPGNVRQLRNVMESAVVLGGAAVIHPEDLLLPAPRAARAEDSSPRSRGTAAGETPWQPMTLEEIEKEHIERVLAHTGGNKKRAAEILGIERCTLYAKLKGYGM